MNLFFFDRNVQSYSIFRIFWTSLISYSVLVVVSWFLLNETPKILSVCYLTLGLSEICVYQLLVALLLIPKGLVIFFPIAMFFRFRKKAVNPTFFVIAAIIVPWFLIQIIAYGLHLKIKEWEFNKIPNSVFVNEVINNALETNNVATCDKLPIGEWPYVNDGNVSNFPHSRNIIWASGFFPYRPTEGYLEDAKFTVNGQEYTLSAYKGAFNTQTSGRCRWLVALKTLNDNLCPNSSQVYQGRGTDEGRDWRLVNDCKLSVFNLKQKVPQTDFVKNQIDSNALVSECESFTNKSTKAECLIDLAHRLRDFNLCEKLDDVQTQAFCYGGLGTELCSNSPDRAFCYLNLALFARDGYLCEKTGRYRNECNLTGYVHIDPVIYFTVTDCNNLTYPDVLYMCSKKLKKSINRNLCNKIFDENIKLDCQNYNEKI